MRSLALVALVVLAAPASATVTIDWVTVGDPGNLPDTEVMNDGTTGYGSVAYTYQVSKFETTNSQYAGFLNAVAASDPNEVYGSSTTMSSSITRTGSEGSFTYSVNSGLEKRPVVGMSWFSALRFANWLHNGQPIGGQDASTMEDGAYTFSGLMSVGARNAEATIFLTSEDEWYKAALLRCSHVQLLRLSDGYQHGYQLRVAPWRRKFGQLRREQPLRDRRWRVPAVCEPFRHLRSRRQCLGVERVSGWRKLESRDSRWRVGNRCRSARCVAPW
jgi:hypothetical protein